MLSAVALTCIKGTLDSPVTCIKCLASTFDAGQNCAKSNVKSTVKPMIKFDACVAQLFHTFDESQR